jgi:hypothetical protein
MRVRILFPAFVSIALCVTARLGAQSIGMQEPASRCSGGSRLKRAGAGAALGAWLGFVGAKIKQSDWSDDSHSASAHRVRTQATVGGALVGAVIGGARLWGRSCNAQSPSAPVRSLQPQPRQPITREEIERFGLNGNVYDLVYSLRRSWLNVRGVETFTEVLVVYLDNGRLGTVDQLRELPVVNVMGLRVYNAAEATYRWGSGHPYGAIEVLTVDPAASAAKNPM